MTKDIPHHTAAISKAAAISRNRSRAIRPQSIAGRREISIEISIPPHSNKTLNSIFRFTTRVILSLACTSALAAAHTSVLVDCGNWRDRLLRRATAADAEACLQIPGNYQSSFSTFGTRFFPWIIVRNTRATASHPQNKTQPKALNRLKKKNKKKQPNLCKVSRA